MGPGVGKFWKCLHGKQKSFKVSLTTFWSSNAEPRKQSGYDSATYLRYLDVRMLLTAQTKPEILKEVIQVNMIALIDITKKFDSWIIKGCKPPFEVLIGIDLFWG